MYDHRLCHRWKTVKCAPLVGLATMLASIISMDSSHEMGVRCSHATSIIWTPLALVSSPPINDPVPVRPPTHYTHPSHQIARVRVVDGRAIARVAPVLRYPIKTWRYAPVCLYGCGCELPPCGGCPQLIQLKCRPLSNRYRSAKDHDRLVNGAPTMQ